MKKYITTNGRIFNFKLGATNIKVGKKPVVISNEHAQMIMRDYKGWIKLAPGEKADPVVAPTVVVEEVKLPEIVQTAPTEPTVLTVDESKLPTDTADNTENAGIEEVKPQELTTDNSEKATEDSSEEEKNATPEEAPVATTEVAATEVVTKTVTEEAPKKATKKATTKTA